MKPIPRSVRFELRPNGPEIHMARRSRFDGWLTSSQRLPSADYPHNFGFGRPVTKSFLHKGIAPSKRFPETLSTQNEGKSQYYSTEHPNAARSSGHEWSRLYRVSDDAPQTPAEYSHTKILCSDSEKRRILLEIGS